MIETKDGGDPAKRPNTPPGAMSRQDLFDKSDASHDDNEEYVDVPDEAHDQLTEVPDETEQVEDTNKGVQKETKKYALKVNGKDIELTEEELITRVQKAESAEQKFEEAARLKREAEELKAQLPVKSDAAKPQVEEDY